MITFGNESQQNSNNNSNNKNEEIDNLKKKYKKILQENKVLKALLDETIGYSEKLRSSFKNNENMYISISDTIKLVLNNQKFYNQNLEKNENFSQLKINSKENLRNSTNNSNYFASTSVAEPNPNLTTNSDIHLNKLNNININLNNSTNITNIYNDTNTKLNLKNIPGEKLQEKKLNKEINNTKNLEKNFLEISGKIEAGELKDSNLNKIENESNLVVTLPINPKGEDLVSICKNLSENLNLMQKNFINLRNDKEELEKKYSIIEMTLKLSEDNHNSLIIKYEELEKYIDVLYKSIQSILVINCVNSKSTESLKCEPIPSYLRFINNVIN